MLHFLCCDNKIFLLILINVTYLTLLQGGLILLDMAGIDPPRILALHDAIALSDDFSSGTPAVKDMATDSSFSTLYVLVNNGMLLGIGYFLCNSKFLSSINKKISRIK